MNRGKLWSLVLAGGLLALLLAGQAQAAALLKKSTTGTPKVDSIDVIRFAPDGLLLIGDGKGGQILAVETGDTTQKPTLKSEIPNINEKMAEKLGTTAKGIELVDLAINPASGQAYVALRKQDDKKGLILTVNGEGKIGAYPLEDVKYARVALPAGDKGPVLKITDLAFANNRILAAAQANEEFGSKIFTIPTPLEHDAKASIFSTETYHVAHGKWETRAPMSSLMALEENGKTYVVGAFACTPIVKYAVDDLQPGTKVKGASVVELGNGNRPLNMFMYEKDGKGYVLINTDRMHHARKPFGPSKYWTARIERELISENDKINEKAQRRVDNNYKTVTDRIKLVEEYHGVVHMDRLDKERALVVKEDGKGGLTMTPLALP